MSYAEDLKKKLALKEQRNVMNQGIPQVPVQNQNVAPVAGITEHADAKAKWGERQKQKDALIEAQAALIAQMTAKLNGTVVNQVSAPFAPAVASTIQPVAMTHLSPYPAGINKKTGRAYPAGIKWHAKPHPVGTTAYGGLSMDDVGLMIMNFPDADSLWAELNGVFDRYGKYSHIAAKANEVDINTLLP